MPIARSQATAPDSDDLVAWVEYLGGDVDKFQRLFGGQSVYVPHSVPASHPLCDALGADIAARLCEELPGVVSYVRTPQRKAVEARRLLVLILTWAGFSLKHIASVGEMTARHACGIRGTLRRDGLLPPAREPGSSLNDERY